MTHVLVLGGGLSGMLAGAALAPLVDWVTIIEQDSLPDSAAPRRGLPQSPHNHMLLAGGAEAIEKLLPGTLDLLYASGAHRRSYLENILIRTAEAWGRRTEIGAYVIACSRDLLDHVVRQQVLKNTAISVVQSADVVGLTGDAARVTGALVQRGDGEPERVEADLVVDATGQRSKAPEWLAGLGLPQVKEEVVDPGFAYSRRIYEAPPGFREDFPGILIQPQHGRGLPGVGGALMPNEDGRWMVVMIGTRGGEPPTDQDGFLAFARGERTWLIGDMITAARPISSIRAYRDLANRRRRYDKLKMPRGFLVIGDAATRVNPTYATGMSTAALSALELHRLAAARGVLDRRFARKAQGRIIEVAVGAWQMALGYDHWFPGVRANVKRRGGKRILRFSNRYMRASADLPAVANATYHVAALLAPASRLMRLPLLLSVLRGPRRPPLTADQAIAQYPSLLKALDVLDAEDRA